MRIGIIGAGFVGGAVIAAFTKCELFIVDPVLTSHKIPDLLQWKPDAVFICLPTPGWPDGSVNASIVTETLDQLPSDLLIIVKSTITPDHLTDRNQRIVYNPEFLTQRTAIKDFQSPDSLIFGGELWDCKEAESLYWECSIVKRCPVFMTDINTAVLVKYTLNCHFSAKVIFMNEIYRLHEKIAGSTWSEFKNILGADSRMGYSHLDVPGPDGYFGFGGACFPKDTKALLKFAESLDCSLTVLKQAIETNELIRNG